MALSVHGRKVHEVLIVTYLLIIVWVLGPALLEVTSVLLTGRPRGLISRSLEQWLKWSNPYYLVEVPRFAPARADVMTYLGFLAGCLAVSAALVVLATARIRRVALGQAGRPAAGAPVEALVVPSANRGPAPPGPSLDPTRWPGASGIAPDLRA